MSKNTIIYILSILVVALIGFTGFYFIGDTVEERAGSAITEWQSHSFLQGLYAGTNRQLQISNSGVITTESAITASGSLTVSGNATYSGDFHVSDTASSTIQVGSTASGVGTGCIVLGDSGGATSTPVYITASGATITATTTQPSICK